MGKTRKSWFVGLGLAAAAAVSCRSDNAGHAHPTPQDTSAMRARVSACIADYDAIALTPEQQAVKNEALSPIPAPCCREYAIATCCCPCNLAKSVWGLSHRLIAMQGQDAAQVRSGVRAFLDAANPRGAAGDACQRGRCGAPLDQDGCGGMDEGHVS